MSLDQQDISIRRAEVKDLARLVESGEKPEIIILRHELSYRATVDNNSTVNCNVVYGKLAKVHETCVRIGNSINDYRILSYPLDDEEVLGLVGSLKKRDMLPVEITHQLGPWKTEIYVVEKVRKDESSSRNPFVSSN